MSEIIKLIEAAEAANLCAQHHEALYNILQALRILSRDNADITSRVEEVKARGISIKESPRICPYLWSMCRPSKCVHCGEMTGMSYNGVPMHPSCTTPAHGMQEVELDPPEVELEHPEEFSKGELLRRYRNQKDWYRKFASCLDGIPAIQNIAGIDGSRQPDDIRKIVKELIIRGIRTR